MFNQIIGIKNSINKIQETKRRTDEFIRDSKRERIRIQEESQKYCENLRKETDATVKQLDEFADAFKAALDNGEDISAVINQFCK